MAQFDEVRGGILWYVVKVSSRNVTKADVKRAAREDRPRISQRTTSSTTIRDGAMTLYASGYSDGLAEIIAKKGHGPSCPATAKITYHTAMWGELDSKNSELEEVK